MGRGPEFCAHKRHERDCAAKPVKMAFEREEFPILRCMTLPWFQFFHVCIPWALGNSSDINVWP